MAAPSITEESLKRLTTVAKKFGCPDIIALRRPTTTPAQIQYLDLLAPASKIKGPLMPQAVAEFQGKPVVYFIDGTDDIPPREDIKSLQQRLANRSEHAVLAVARPGDLTLYPINLDIAELQDGRWETIKVTSPEAPYLFQSLACGDKVLPGSSNKPDPVFSEIHRLLGEASLRLAGENGAGPMDGLSVLSMTGRALFFRFLKDRRIVQPSDLSDICPSIKDGDLTDVFSTAERAAQTSAWLDETFNGDLLPLVDAITKDTSKPDRRRLYLEAYSKAGTDTNSEVFTHLEAILKGWEHVGNGHMQQTLLIDWDDLNFRHIPVGVLSQVYESFSHQWDPDAARDNSVHYTPKNLAKLLVDQTLAGLEDAHRARVLDPSCGAGVFLVLAFRELVRRRWEHDAKRPGTKVIHDVLYKQLCGFDVSESALRLSALGLYITAIELNEIIRPASEFHAPRALKDSVLFNQGPKDISERKRGFVLGSLSDEVDKAFDGAFDAVIGNPPWTRLTPKGDADEVKRLAALNKQFTAIGKRALTTFGLIEDAKDYQNPGGVPDIPFIWRATEWVKPGGIIGFALEARLVLTQSGPGKSARDAIFRAITVTGILNGSDLEKTNVWECHDQPWLLIWARNEKPAVEDYEFNFLTPVRENDLCDKGEFRLDYQSAYKVNVKSVIERGWLFKALAMGTTLDVQVMDKLAEAEARQTIKTFWTGDLVSCQGFGFKARDKKPPSWLLDLPVFEPPNEQALPGPLNGLRTYLEHYGAQPLECPRRKDNYCHPLLVVARTPGEDRSTPKSYLISDRDVCFEQRFYGYSAAKHRDATLLIALLHLIVHSNLFRHSCYMRSAWVGAKHRIIAKEDLDKFPFPLLSELTAKDRATALELASSIYTPATADWKALDKFVCKLFHLTAAEAEVVNETVRFNGPYQTTRGPAAQPPKDLDLSDFATCLEKSLQPFFKVVDQKVEVAFVPKVNDDWNPPWRFVTVMVDGNSFEPSPAFIAKLMREAAETSASRVIMAVPGGGLVMGLLNQRRFWTRSRARLCSLHISREHLEKHFPLPAVQ